MDPYEENAMEAHLEALAKAAEDEDRYGPQPDDLERDEDLRRRHAGPPDPTPPEEEPYWISIENPTAGFSDEEIEDLVSDIDAGRAVGPTDVLEYVKQRAAEIGGERRRR